MQIVRYVPTHFWLFLLLMSSEIVARTPLELLASSVHAMQASEVPSSTESSLAQSSTVSKYSYHDIELVEDSTPHSYVLLSPNWTQDDNRRVDTQSADSNSHPMVVAWPSGVVFPAAPARGGPVSFIAAMALPSLAQNTDPMLNNLELSEVVYYTNIDLRKLNTSSDQIIGDKNLNVDIMESAPSAFDEEPTYLESERVRTTPVFATTNAAPTTTLDGASSSTPKYKLISTQLPAVATVANEIDFEADSSPHTQGGHRRAWSYKEVLLSRDQPRHVNGYSVAYIVVGTSCALSIITLIIVLMVLRIRGNKFSRRYARHRRPAAGLPPRCNAESSDSTSDSTSNASSDQFSEVQLPHSKLFDLMNLRSQEASTHKLGPWFNGRSSVLSARHSTSMAFPVIQKVPNNEIAAPNNAYEHDDILDISDNSVVSVSVSQQQVSSMTENCGHDGVITPSTVSSKHDTFIFWSANCDRLV